VAAFFATAPKLAAMVLIARVLTEPFAAMADQWQQIVIVLAILLPILSLNQLVG